MKIKSVALHPDLPPEIKEPTKFASDDATLNVSARLCNSNPVQIAMNAAVTDVVGALGVENGDPKALKKKRMRAKDFANGNGEETVPGNQDQPFDQQIKKSPLEAERLDDAAESVESDDYGEYDDRLASSSDDDDDDEARDHDGDVAELEAQLAQEGIRDRKANNESLKYDLEVDLSLSDAESGIRSVTPEPRKAPASRTQSFIPSLTMGGYVSGSGSDIEEVDAAPKRNRRGQRARQQIWEQKYGPKAKHLQKQDRNSGWDKKRGAVEGHGRGGNERGRQRARLNDGDASAGNAKFSSKTTESKQTNAQDGPIHPSWEAAKKAKERREAPVAFKGTKITFD